MSTLPYRISDGDDWDSFATLADAEDRARALIAEFRLSHVLIFHRDVKGPIARVQADALGRVWLDVLTLERDNRGRLVA